MARPPVGCKPIEGVGDSRAACERGSPLAGPEVLSTVSTRSWRCVCREQSACVCHPIGLLGRSTHTLSLSLYPSNHTHAHPSSTCTHAHTQQDKGPALPEVQGGGRQAEEGAAQGQQQITTGRAEQAHTQAQPSAGTPDATRSTPAGVSRCV